MSDLSDARAALATLLNTVPGVRAVTAVPATFTPPIVWVTSGVPYRQAGQTFAKKRINLVAVCLGGMSTNDATVDATDALAELVADKIDTSGHISPNFRLDPEAELDQARLYPSGQGQQMLGIAVNCFCESTRA